MTDAERELLLLLAKAPRSKAAYDHGAGFAKLNWNAQDVQKLKRKKLQKR